MLLYHFYQYMHNILLLQIFYHYLIFRYDVLEYWKTGIKKPISKQLYKHLEKKMKQFLLWYDEFKDDEYLPKTGAISMYSYDIIHQTYLMNKQNKDLKKILLLWNSRIKIANVNSNLENASRIEKNDLLDIHDDPMIQMF